MSFEVIEELKEFIDSKKIMMNFFNLSEKMKNIKDLTEVDN